MASPELPVRGGLELHPFRGVRYAVDDLAAVTTPPYDLISADDARNLLASHPNNVVRLILPGADQHRYGEAHETLLTWLEYGVLVPDPSPSLYIYEQHGVGISQRGIIGDVALAQPEQRIILPHEDVTPGVVADRLGLMRATGSNLEPIFLVYDGGGATTRLVDDVAETRIPLINIRADGIRHRLWAISDPVEIEAIAADLRDRQALIADGHHRYATYLALQREHHAAGHGNGPWDRGLALLVDWSAYPPEVRPIHRVIPGLPLTEAAARARGSWRVHDFEDLEEALAALASAHEPAFVLAGDGMSHLLTDPDPLQVEHAMPRDMSKRWRSLNTSILTEFLLPKVWGVADNEKTVLVVHHDALTAVRLARRHGGTAVILNPLAVEDVLAVAAQGERLPRKSTSFSPKPRTGLVLRTFDTA